MQKYLTLLAFFVAFAATVVLAYQEASALVAKDEIKAAAEFKKLQEGLSKTAVILSTSDVEKFRMTSKGKLYSEIKEGGSFSGYFVLALQKCEEGDDWTVHGLWPQTSATSWPSYCGGPAFSQSEVSSIWSDLNQYWPSCAWSHTSEDDFLSHEWEKHGTCSGMDEKTYFETALNLFSAGAWKSSCAGEDKECKVNYQNLPNGTLDH